MMHLIRDTDAARQLGIPVREVLDMIERGELHAFQRDERVWVDDDEIRAALSEPVDLGSL